LLEGIPLRTASFRAPTGESQFASIQSSMFLVLENTLLYRVCRWLVFRTVVHRPSAHIPPVNGFAVSISWFEGELPTAEQAAFISSPFPFDVPDHFHKCTLSDSVFTIHHDPFSSRVRVPSCFFRLRLRLRMWITWFEVLENFLEPHLLHFLSCMPVVFLTDSSVSSFPFLLSLRPGCRHCSNEFASNFALLNTFTPLTVKSVFLFSPPLLVFACTSSRFSFSPSSVLPVPPSSLHGRFSRHGLVSLFSCNPTSQKVR